MTLLFGTPTILDKLSSFPGEELFSERVIAFCDAVSTELVHSPEGRKLSDITALGFWLRRASVMDMRDRFIRAKESSIRLGRGLVFHIVSSYAPVSFAYSLFAGLLCGNANVVMIPSYDSPQVDIILQCIKNALNDGFAAYVNRICIVRNDHDQEACDLLSSVCNVRVIWGSDDVVSDIRRSPLSPDGSEVVISEGFSLTVIDIAAYSSMDDGARDSAVRGFFYDAYLADQNISSPPQLVVWKGNIEFYRESIDDFWQRLWQIVGRVYHFGPSRDNDAQVKVEELSQKMDIEIVNIPGSGDEFSHVRILSRLDEDGTTALRECLDRFGSFIEYFSYDLSELHDLLGDIHCRTIGYIGSSEMFLPLVKSGIRGVDMIVPVGRTMDFDLIWDGCDLVERLTRTVRIK